MTRILMMVILALMIMSMQGQQNLALNAVASASASSSGSYGPANWNDGMKGPQYYFGWVGTAATFVQPAWIQYEWTTQQTLNRIIFWPPTWSQPGYVYFTGSAKVHYWDGNAWISHHTFQSGLPGYIDTINFATINTTKVRITNFVITGQDNPGWDEIEVFNNPVVSNDPDLKICGIYAPADTVVANSPLIVEVYVCNVGNVTVDSFHISYWPVGSPAATTENWIGTPGLAPGDTALHAFSVPLMVPWGTSALCVYTDYPGDVNPFNDTLCKTIFAPGGPIGISKSNPDMDQSAGVRIFPQPANNLLNVEFDHHPGLVRWNLTDLKGRIMNADLVSCHNAGLKINTSALKPGVYLLTCEWDNHRSVHKVFISN
ncbi:MAG: T9SS type A sorting domain-containing protein [Bacteroidales bacterium]